MFSGGAAIEETLLDQAPFLTGGYKLTSFYGTGSGREVVPNFGLAAAGIWTSRFVWPGLPWGFPPRMGLCKQSGPSWLPFPVVGIVQCVSRLDFRW